MRPVILARSLPLLASLCFALSACTAPVDEEDGAAISAAVTNNPEYDEVVRDGTKVATNTTRNAEQSASTRLIGFVPGTERDRVLDRLLSVDRWTEIRDPDGDRPFTSSELVSDTTENGTRTVVVMLTLEGNVKLEIRGTAKEGDGRVEIRMTNSTAYKHWLIGTVLEKNKLHISFDLVPYEDGVIVDATMRAKLKKKEEKAAKLTGSLSSIFDWIAAGSR